MKLISCCLKRFSKMGLLAKQTKDKRKIKNSSLSVGLCDSYLTIFLAKNCLRYATEANHQQFLLNFRIPKLKKCHRIMVLKNQFQNFVPILFVG